MNSCGFYCNEGCCYLQIVLFTLVSGPNIITFMVRWGIFSHLTMKVCREVEVEQNYTHKYAGNDLSRFFYLGSGDLGLRF